MDRPLRICMITTFYPPYNFGGDGIFVQRLANALALHGHRVEVIHCRDAYRLLAGRESAATTDDHPNVTVHGLQSPVGMLSPVATHQTGIPFFKIARIQQILETGFDVIHYHNISLVGGPKILTCGQGIKLYTLHEYWLRCPTHALFRFNRAACERPSCFLCNLSHWRPPQWWRYIGLLPAALKHVDAMIAPSRFCRDKHLRMGFEVPIVHLPNFVPDIPFATESTHDDREVFDDPYFLFVGRLEKLKGLQTLIPVFRHFRKAQLLIAGTGNYEPQLRHLAAGCDNIRFLGHITGQQLQERYRRAVALIVPSICYEIFPLVIIEAFRQHTPAVVRNLGGMPEIIAESGGGYTYETEGELLSALTQLLNTPSLRHDLGLHGYNAFQKKWRVDVHLQGYFALIDALKAKRKATGFAVGT